MVRSVRPSKRMVQVFIPNAITGGAILSGYLSILLTFRGDYNLAAACILGACVLDMLDGWAARTMNAATDFGVQFDSLADMVNYGVAPALLFYFLYFEIWGVVGIGLSFMPVCCSAIRLARFNIAADPDIPTRYFVGLPTTFGALVLAGFVIFTDYVSSDLAVPQAAFVTASISLLMISNVQYEKSNILSLRYILKTRRVLTGLFIVVSMILTPQVAFFTWGLLYILYGVTRSGIRTILHGDDTAREAEIGEEW